MTPITEPQLRQLDHVVLAVHDLARASENFRALGFTVTPGGAHPGRTSHNALVVFEDGAYIEIIAWRAPAPEERWWRTLQAHGEGLVDHALLPGAVGPALAAAQARGLGTLRGPIPGGRHRPDGVRIDWESARHDTPDVPFLCADLTPRALRVPEGAARQHANRATGIAHVAVAARDFELTRTRWQALLGPDLPLQPRPGGASYRLADTDFELFRPLAGVDTSRSAIDFEVAKPLQERLARQGEGDGEGPFALQVRGQGPAKRLDPARTHGMPLWLGGDAG